ncbi:MAG: hypothetical protein ACRCVA_09195 [Phreatobacter sp.]
MTSHILGLDESRRGAIGVHSTGLALGSLLGGAHLLWALLVASGFAQSVMDFIFWLHFIRPVWVIEGFNVGKAAGLIGLTGVIGYALGAAFAFLWNRLRRASP